ncbi:uncharacterized protein LOC128995147 [Macrosteles quadrilineatus]|uniref:uncharacterized protein LOC128995147 n=1 Tax=Macrosteles quadrilineatus TaxID=74068 RepID=UPI0023E256DB|nr:uncharacterized protein LOC128995147 [Macrosteles quadrilineatus]
MEQQNQQYIIVEGTPDNAEEYVLIEIDENMPQEELIKFAQELNKEPAVIESPPVAEPVKEEPIIQKKQFKALEGRAKQKTKDGMYSNVLKNFTKDWEAMVLRVSDKEREQDHAEEQRELAQQQAWEKRLIQRQSAALTQINNDFLNGLRELLQEYKARKQ